MSGFRPDSFLTQLHRGLTCAINTNKGLSKEILYRGFPEHTQFPDLFLLPAIVWQCDEQSVQWLTAGYSRSQSYSMKLFHYSSATRRRCLLSLCRTAATQLPAQPQPCACFCATSEALQRWRTYQNSQRKQVLLFQTKIQLATTFFFWIRTKVLMKNKTPEVEKRYSCVFSFVFKFLILSTWRCRTFWNDGLCQDSSALN